MAAMRKRTFASTISAVLLSGELPGVAGTSSKMDFLPLGNVRTDPVLSPSGLSDHVHTFYGAAASLRPETSYGEMRAACGNSGNVDENKSLYWHPAIYRVENGIYHLVPINFASAYYVWHTGDARAFPDGFQMIAMQSNGPKARVKFDCSGQSACEREDCSVPAGHCAGRDSTTCFPEAACYELEMKIVFPACWDGESLTSSDFMSHVAYTEGDWGSEPVDDRQAPAYAADCPASHPVRIPEIQLYFRVKEYQGGHHVFSDGTTMIHADYFSGWDQRELQRVLDGCENPSEAASSDAWCEDHFTFRDLPKIVGDDNIVSKLQQIQPDPPLDLQGTVTAEEVDNVPVLPRSATGGELLPADPNLDWRCTPNCTLLGGGRGSRGTCDGPAPPTTSTTTAPPAACKRWCSRNGNSWETKCRWKKCRGCSQCSAQLLASRSEEPLEAELPARRQEEGVSRGQAARKRGFLHADLDTDSGSLAQLSVQLDRGALRTEEL